MQGNAVRLQTGDGEQVIDQRLELDHPLVDRGEDAVLFRRHLQSAVLQQEFDATKYGRYGSLQLVGRHADETVFGVIEPLQLKIGLLDPQEVVLQLLAAPLQLLVFLLHPVIQGMVLDENRQLTGNGGEQEDLPVGRILFGTVGDHKHPHHLLADLQRHHTPRLHPHLARCRQHIRRQFLINGFRLVGFSGQYLA